ncbi:hypothetical protein DFH05DRAFT_202624 [Lentinula detonsa]|uniref:F-box domain-containing protein n=1 Tax=Lentinula detonsa TaxID=2804962 RepID=A0A9W8NWK1_9AGAR|nr:hypothetical protein DFH05DRAFT_202624 [Lentinula detonsa]
MSNLPQELIDRIIDELSNLIEDLRNLSLVCRPWLRRARYHLFRSITLGPRDLKEIREHYAYVKQKASRRGWDPDDRLSFEEEKLLRSPLAEIHSLHSYSYLPSQTRYPSSGAYAYYLQSG